MASTTQSGGSLARSQEEDKGTTAKGQSIEATLDTKQPEMTYPSQATDDRSRARPDDRTDVTSRRLSHLGTLARWTARGALGLFCAGLLSSIADSGSMQCRRSDLDQATREGWRGQLEAPFNAVMDFFEPRGTVVVQCNTATEPGCASQDGEPSLSWFARLRDGQEMQFSFDEAIRPLPGGGGLYAQRECVLSQLGPPNGTVVVTMPSIEETTGRIVSIDGLPFDSDAGDVGSARLECTAGGLPIFKSPIFHRQG